MAAAYKTIKTAAGPPRTLTPVLFFKSLGFHCYRGGLVTARQLIMDDVGAVEIRRLADFIENEMPHSVEIDDAEVLAIKELLIKEGHIEVVDDIDEEDMPYQYERWTLYPKPPTDLDARESECFSNFTLLCNTITRLAQQVCNGRNHPEDGDPAIIKMINIGNDNLHSEVANSSRPDAAFIVKDDTIYLPDPASNDAPLDKNADDENGGSSKKAPKNKSKRQRKKEKKSSIQESQRKELEDMKALLDEHKALLASFPNQPRDIQFHHEEILKRKYADMEKGNDNDPDSSDEGTEILSDDNTSDDPDYEENPTRKPRTDERWTDIGVVIEWKKSVTMPSQYDNMVKVITGGNQNLRNDPRRRFGFGTTVDNTNFHIWKFTRAGVVVSEGINWYLQIDIFIRLIAMFATASRTELGWDPTVQRAKVGDTIQYIYTIGGEQYVTYGKPLCDYRADVMLGRGTRVLLVYKLGTDPRDETNLHVMKDLWIKEGSVRDGVALKDVRKNTMGKLRKYFLKPIGDELVTVYSARLGAMVHDTTRLFISESEQTGDKAYYLWDYQEGVSKIAPDPASMRGYSHGLVPSIDESKLTQAQRNILQDSRVSHREHSRTLFKEVCDTLHEVYNLRLYFRGILDASRALQAMHKLGWLHRDISTGNVLYCRQKPRVAKLSDMEYRKDMNNTVGREDFRTGTFQFMSVEVHDQRVINVELLDDDDFDDDYRSRYKDENRAKKRKLSENVAKKIVVSDSDDSESEGDISDTDSDDSEGYDYQERIDEDSDSAPSESAIEMDQFPEPEEIFREKLSLTRPLRYTILHEFESLFWMSLWGILHHLPSGFTARASLTLELIQQMRTASEVFPTYPQKLPMIRYRILMVKGELEEVLGTLPKIYTEAAFAIVQMRNLLRRSYIKHYRTTEPGATFPYNKYFYKEFRDYVRLITDDKTYNFKTLFISEPLLKYYEDKTGHKVADFTPVFPIERNYGPNVNATPNVNNGDAASTGTEIAPGSQSSSSIAPGSNLQPSQPAGPSSPPRIRPSTEGTGEENRVKRFTSSANVDVAALIARQKAQNKRSRIPVGSGGPTSSSTDRGEGTSSRTN